LVLCRCGTTDELIEICRELARCGGLSVWHVRARDLGLFGGIEEVIKVAEVTGVKTHFSHYAANGAANWGRSGELLEIIDKARSRGLDVTFDAYPYDASSTTMNILLPGWVHAGGTAEMLKRLGLTDRGLIKPGLAADLVVFDPETVQDRATFDNPTRYPTGIQHVIVNGAVVIDGGEHTGLLNGRVLSGV